MYVILFVVGIVVALLGAVLIRYGVPLDEYGNSPLLVSGMIAFIGGLILVGLSAAVRSLSRIAERLDIQPLPLPQIADVEVASPMRRPPPAPAPVVKPVPVPEAAVAAPEPRVEPRVEQRVEPRVEPRAEPPARPAPAGDKPPERSSLLGWFGKSRKPVIVGRKGAAPPLSDEPPAPAGVDLEPLTHVPERDAAPPRQPAAPAPTDAPPAAAEAPASATVYRSGTIDGMAYTLYTDGSIEAELPQGKIRFASVEELQAYLTRR